MFLETSSCISSIEPDPPRSFKAFNKGFISLLCDRTLLIIDSCENGFDERDSPTVTEPDCSRNAARRSSEGTRLAMMVVMDAGLIELLRCPRCAHPVGGAGEGLRCEKCGASYPTS